MTKVFIEDNNKIIDSFNYNFDGIPDMLNIIEKDNTKYQVIEILYTKNKLEKVKVKKYFNQGV